MQECGKYYL
jgi:hypothetical protein